MRKILYFLGELSDSDVEWLLNTGSYKRLEPGTVLIQKNRPVEGLYLVIEGQLGVVGDSEGRKVIARLGQGEMVGEMSFVEGRNPSVYVRALDRSTILLIPRADLSLRLRQDVGFAARFYRALTLFLSHRLRGTTSQLGYGDTRELDALQPAEDPDELSESVMENVYLAGTRFDSILKRLKSS